jgi:hypothetical protein
MTQHLYDLDTFVVDDFFNQQLITDLWNECKKLESVDFVDQHGVFKGQLISKQTHIEPESAGPFLNTTLEQVRSLFDRDVFWSEIVYSQLFLPWDIHCDLVRPNSTNPYFNLLIPFTNVDSSTVIFNEKSPGYNDFWKYKRDYQPHNSPVLGQIWDKYLSMCWPEDRNWLSVKEILPSQKSGQLIGFKRDLWHSSDSFHLKGVNAKHFLQILVDTV